MTPFLARRVADSAFTQRACNKDRFIAHRRPWLAVNFLILRYFLTTNRPLISMLRSGFNRRLPMDHQDIRRHIIIAIFSDDVLVDAMVVKGGSALELIHKIQSRASIDVDFSMGAADDDLDDQELASRIQASLTREFRSVSLEMIDYDFQVKPNVRRPGLPDWWGGYMVSFKLVPLALAQTLHDRLDDLRKQALDASPRKKKSFKIDISRHEYVDAKAEVDLEDFTVFVYSPTMIVIEKLRAICQQMDGYDIGVQLPKSPRARDFYDIVTVISHYKLDLTTPDNVVVGRAIFDVKQVPYSLLDNIHETKGFHEADWSAVIDAARVKVEPFDHYFDFVTALARQLKRLWDV